MHARAHSPETIDRRINLRLTSRSLAPRVLPALEALGYSLRETIDATHAREAQPGFWLVDEARLGEIPSLQEAPHARILLIASSWQDEHEDPRILARATRPAHLAEIFSMIQSTIERTPRRMPRVRTRLSARCIRSDRRTIGALLSLSEGGCLLRTDDLLRKGNQVHLQFALPDYGLVSTQADCRYTNRGNAGLQFAEPPQDIRQSIGHFVTLQLATSSSPGLHTHSQPA